jgi:hypothetical protein
MAAGVVERSAHDQRSSGIALDQQDHLTVAQQRCQRSRHCRLRITAGHHDDEIGTVDGRSRIARCALDGSEPGPLALDIDAAEGSDVREPRIVDVVQPHLVPGDPELSGEVNSANSGADDCDRLDRISAHHDCSPCAASRESNPSVRR